MRIEFNHRIQLSAVISQLHVSYHYLSRRSEPQSGSHKVVYVFVVIYIFRWTYHLNIPTHFVMRLETRLTTLSSIKVNKHCHRWEKRVVHPVILRWAIWKKSCHWYCPVIYVSGSRPVTYCMSYVCYMVFTYCTTSRRHRQDVKTILNISRHGSTVLFPL